MDNSNRDLLEELFTATINDLLEKVRSGNATAADLSVAAKMLRDNGVDAIPTETSPLGELAKELPFNGVEEITTEQQVVEGI